MGARIARFGAPMLLTLTTAGSAQSQISVIPGGGFSIGEGELFVTYAWESGLHRSGYTLRLRVVEINASSKPRVPDLVCEITIDTELDLVPVEKDCSAGPAPLAPGDSAWTWLNSVIRSPPGEYALAWGLEGRPFSSGTVQVLEAGLDRQPDLLGGRIPFVLELTGEKAALHSAREIEVVAQGALLQGARGPHPVIFQVDDEAARRMQELTPVLRLTFEFSEDGEVTFLRCWKGAPSTSLLSHLCGVASKASFFSEIGLGTWIYTLLVREGEYFVDAAR